MGAVRVIGAIDLMAGRAVHARGGRRADYVPVRRVADSPIVPGDPVALARAYIGRGVGELYTADLDAIAGGAPQDAVVAAIAALGVPLWLDAGVSSVDRALQSLDLGASRVIVGLETLPSVDRLAEICGALGSGRVAFSLDLRDGEPIVTGTLIARADPAPVIAARAVGAGADAVIVLDLARVGTDRGIDFELIARVRDCTAGAALIVGGGVRGFEDLERLAACGCDGALVATALIEGRIAGVPPPSNLVI